MRGSTRLVVHHRDERNAQRLLITLCIRCHVRLHHSRRFREWVPEALLELWREVHPGAPLQLQLPFVMKTSGNCTPAITHEKVIGRLRQVEVVQVRSQFIGRL
jgi:hypothetical protein